MTTSKPAPGQLIAGLVAIVAAITGALALPPRSVGERRDRPPRSRGDDADRLADHLRLPGGRLPHASRCTLVSAY
jgi:hypothetical protein